MVSESLGIIEPQFFKFEGDFELESGKILEGYHFDTGNPEGLVKASNFFLKNSKLILEKY